MSKHHNLSKISSHGSQEWVLALPASSLEVIHGDIPDHTATKSLLLDVVHLVLDRFKTVVSDPLVSFVSVGSDGAVTSLNLGPSLVLQVQADLGKGEVSKILTESLRAISTGVYCLISKQSILHKTCDRVKSSQVVCKLLPRSIRGNL